MTKAEVQSNIRYNQGLVEQYSNTISRLQSQINELERLRMKYQGLQNSFGNRQSDRKRKLASVFSAKANVRMLSIYASAMNSLLSGSEYMDAYNGLSVAQERINSQIRELSWQINDNVAKINYRQGRIDYWTNQLQYITSKK